MTQKHLWFYRPLKREVPSHRKWDLQDKGLEEVFSERGEWFAKNVWWSQADQCLKVTQSLLAWGAWIEIEQEWTAFFESTMSLLAWGEWIEIGSVYERGWISSQFCDNHDFLKNFIAIQVNTHPVMNAFTLSLSHSIFIPIDIRHATMIRIDRIFFMRTSRESDIMLIKQEAWLPARLESLKLIYVCGVCVFGTLFVLTSCF